MREDVLFSVDTLYRPNLEVKGFRFGGGKKALCVMGSTRGNEVQQTFVCAQLVKALKELEERGALRPGFEILVIPSVNQSSINVGRRFWASDNTDINRMFPGYDKGETTQRIADKIFQAVKDYESGIQLASFYLPGDFQPHVRVMKTGYERVDLAEQFGLPYVVNHDPDPFDTTTLNYNWLVWATNAFSLYTKETDQIDDKSAREAVLAILRFLYRQGWLLFPMHGGCVSTVLEDTDMTRVLTPAGGFFRRFLDPGHLVRQGEVLAEILSPYDASVVAQIKSPCYGVIFFAHKSPMTAAHEVAFEIVSK